MSTQRPDKMLQRMAAPRSGCSRCAFPPPLLSLFYRWFALAEVFLCFVIARGEPIPHRTEAGVRFVNPGGLPVFTNVFQHAERFSEGLAVITQGGHFGAIDLSGRIVVPCEFHGLGSFSGGVAPAFKNRWGVIDASGKWITAPKYAELTSFVDGIAIAKMNGKFNVVSPAGLVLSEAFDTFFPISEGSVAVARSNVWLYLAATGLPMSTNRFDKALGFLGGVGRAMKDGKWGVISRSGTWQVPPEFDFVGEFKEGLIAVRKGSKWGWIDLGAKFIIPAEYDFAGSFSEGVAPVRKGDKWGYIDRQARVVIAFRFNDASAFSEGLALVQELDGYRYIDHRGHQVFGDMDLFVSAEPFKAGVARVALGSWLAPKWRFLTREGKLF